MRQFHGPVVAVGEAVDGFPVVMPNEKAVGRLAFEHLRSKGFRRLGYWGPVAWSVRRALGDADDGVFYDRYQAFVEIADEHGVGPIVIPPAGLLESVFESFGPRRMLTEWLREVPKPIGLFCANNMLGREAILACRAAGLPVPESVAVLGVDHDDLLMNLTRPPLSTIDHGMTRVGYESAALLDRILAGESDGSYETPVLVPPVRVEQRQSTDTLAVEDEDVRDAMRLISMNALNQLRARDVVAAATVSRRTLEPKFQRIIGRSIKQEIVRQQIEHAKKLLASRDLKLTEVATRCGFNSASRLAQAFKAATGIGPSNYRRHMRVH
jgi:LacI family transcriptional regulator